ncbi:hypothetical protein [Paracidovorax wautersii]|uniref:Type IV pili methyl-accepting chemotaxis transducer N-term n=1 Tax=Paracidovorax wautersii TaxID=1177982 RepID=A0A1I2HML1_9BURK|nr:hypothetical protein [Paracidovorax wautersii]SFF31545.1 hypothetical protein SAMN04489711_1275 [Paracidovorax wautersii]
MAEPRKLCAILVAFLATAGSAHAFTGILDQKLSALRVMTSQIATSSKAQINATISIVQGEMGARGVLAGTTEQLDLYRSFSAIGGQGVQMCDAVSQRNDIDTLSRAQDSYQFVAVANSGRTSARRDNYEIVRAEKQMDAYCSAEEHNLGICKSRFDGMENASSSFNKLMGVDQFTNKQLKAAEEFIANAVPAPRAMPQVSRACDAACKSARVAAMRMDAASSMTAATLAMQLSSRIGAKTFAERK